jgi:LPXTG-motif cell wall-anchored protein
VKVHNLTKSVLVALLVASPLVGAETQYPASDFQPEIIKQDAELISKHAEAGKTQAASDTKPAAATVSKSESKTEATPTSVASAKKTEEDSNLPMILGAAVAAAAAFWFLRKGKNAPVDASSYVASAPAAKTGTTGVERYVSNQSTSIDSNATGVARYVASMAESAPAKPQTGVAKYVVSLAATESSSGSSSKQPTGVEKYVANLPEAAKPAGETGVAKYMKSQGLAA